MIVRIFRIFKQLVNFIYSSLFLMHGKGNHLRRIVTIANRHIYGHFFANGYRVILICHVYRERVSNHAVGRLACIVFKHELITAFGSNYAVIHILLPYAVIIKLGFTHSRERQRQFNRIFVPFES